MIDIALPRGAVLAPRSSGDGAFRNAVSGISRCRPRNLSAAVLLEVQRYGKPVALPQRPLPAKIMGRRAIITLGRNFGRKNNGQQQQTEQEPEQDGTKILSHLIGPRK
jgi:hypothetical protein